MKPCRTDDGEIGIRNAFLPMSSTATVTPHTEMFNDLLKLAVDSGVSDVIIKSNKPGYVRIAGKLKPVDMDPIFVKSNKPGYVRIAGKLKTVDMDPITCP